VKLAHGPWRLSRSPGLAFALPAKYFAELGLPMLFIKTTSSIEPPWYVTRMPGGVGLLLPISLVNIIVEFLP
jgi:hypothetical protein